MYDQRNPIMSYLQVIADMLPKCFISLVSASADTMKMLMWLIWTCQHYKLNVTGPPPLDHWICCTLVTQSSVLIGFMFYIKLIMLLHRWWSFVRSEVSCSEPLGGVGGNLLDVDLNINRRSKSTGERGCDTSGGSAMKLCNWRGETGATGVWCQGNILCLDTDTLQTLFLIFFFVQKLATRIIKTRPRR